MNIDTTVLLAFWNKAWPLLLVIAFDLLLGIVKSVKAKEFDWGKLPQFLETYGIKLLGWTILEIMTIIPSDLVETSQAVDVGVTALAWTAYIGLFGATFKSIIGHLVDFGVLPEILKKVASKVGMLDKNKLTVG